MIQLFQTILNDPLKFFQTYSGGWLHAGDPVAEETHSANLVEDFMPSSVS